MNRRQRRAKLSKKKGRYMGMAKDRQDSLGRLKKI